MVSYRLGKPQELAFMAPLTVKQKFLAIQASPFGVIWSSEP